MMAAPMQESLVATFGALIAERIERREFLRKKPPLCPACGDEQVQLSHIYKPAHWRCRICKAKFQFEPEPNQ